MQLLPHEGVRTWYENLARRNQATADDYLRRLGRNLEQATGKTPIDLLSMSQSQLEDTAAACVSHMFKKGLAGSTVQAFYVTLTSFLKWHQRELHRNIAIPGAEDYLNAENETIPDQAALRRVLDAAEVRTAAMICIIAQGGQRLQVLGKEEGQDGLRLRDVQGIVLSEDDVAFDVVPVRVDVQRSLSKSGKAFFFFLGLEGCERIRAYLRTRIQKGEALGPDSPLFRPYGGEPRFMLRNNVGDAIRRAMQTANVQGRPYVWRSYYAHHCQLAESQGFLESWRKFFMGHRGSIQATYSTRKKGLPANSIELMRAGYSKALPYLESNREAATDPMRKLAEGLLRASGATPEQLSTLDLAAMNEEAVLKVMTDALATGVRQPKARAPASQRVVALGDVAPLLEQGWTYKATLGKQVIVEMP